MLLFVNHCKKISLFLCKWQKDCIWLTRQSISYIPRTLLRSRKRINISVSHLAARVLVRLLGRVSFVSQARSLNLLVSFSPSLSLGTPTKTRRVYRVGINKFRSFFQQKESYEFIYFTHSVRTEIKICQVTDEIVDASTFITDYTRNPSPSGEKTNP